jgi:predicted HicB family RNase H-like nuclease
MAKKTFKNDINPAMGFISQESIEKVEETATEKKTPAKAPEGYKLNPLYIETKSKRLQLLIQPSTHEKLKNRAKAEGTSVNDLVNSILIEALSEE